MNHRKACSGEEMCRKNVKKLMKFCKIDDFLKMIPDQLESILTSKKQYFKAKNDDF